MLNEQELRRPDFEPGVPVLMADGREWHLPSPRVRLAPSDDDRGFKTVFSRPDGGVFAGLMARYDKLTESDDMTVSALAAIELAIGRHLLLSNYDLDGDRVASLLQFAYDAKADPEGYAIREACLGVVFGYDAPKRSADGDASPSSSTA